MVHWHCFPVINPLHIWRCSTTWLTSIAILGHDDSQGGLAVKHQTFVHRREFHDHRSFPTSTMKNMGHRLRCWTSFKSHEGGWPSTTREWSYRYTWANFDTKQMRSWGFFSHDHDSQAATRTIHEHLLRGWSKNGINFCRHPQIDEILDRSSFNHVNFGASSTRVATLDLPILIDLVESIHPVRTQVNILKKLIPAS